MTGLEIESGMIKHAQNKAGDLPLKNLMSMKFSKYHGLGNDYIVLDPAEWKQVLSQEAVRLICHRNYGVGSDGILLGPLPSTKCDFGLRILNPDGSEAEKSGNGLRIFARWIVDNGLSSASSFTVETAGGPVSCSVSLDCSGVTVEMGVVSFESSKIPVTGAVREVIEETLVFGEQVLRFCAASVGNPHCVVLVDRPSPEIARQLGPLIECHPIFPYRTNVQFMQILDRSNIRIEIWERGAGYTLASGSCSTAAAAVAHKLNLCDSQIKVHMPGGQLVISLDSNFAATMSGPVTKICEGTLSHELFSKLGSEF